MKLVVDSCKATAPSSSIIVYASPQSLVTKDTRRSPFLEFVLGNHNLLSMIVIDEIHLLTDFGRSFRTEFNMLKDELFQTTVKETKDDATPDDYAYHVAICLESFLFIFRRINHPESQSSDPGHRKYQVQELMDVASLLSSSVQCYYMAIKTKLGNPNGDDEGVQERCGTCPNFLGQKICP